MVNINSATIVSMTDANKNFSRVAKIADKNGEAIIFRNNKPKYKLIDLEQTTDMELSDDEKIDIAAMRVLTRYRKAFEELAK